MTVTNKKHQEFINQYFLRKMNGTDAYMDVYPKASYDTARANASKLLADTNIKAEIERRLKENQMSADEVLIRLADMARSDISAFLDVSRPSDLADEKYKGKTHVIKKFKRKITRDALGREHEELELELYDAQAALEKLGRYHGLFNDKLQIDWRIEIVNSIKRGELTPQDVLNELGDSIEARALLESAGVLTIEGRATEVESEATLSAASAD